MAIVPPGVAIWTVDVPVAAADAGPAADAVVAVASVLASKKGVGSMSVMATPAAAPPAAELLMVMTYCAVVCSGSVRVGVVVAFATVKVGKQDAGLGKLVPPKGTLARPPAPAVAPRALKTPA